MKRIALNLRIAVRALLSFKARSTLAILGVFLGTLSLIVVYNLTGSLALKAQNDLDKLGKNMLVARSGLVLLRFGQGARFMSEDPNLTMADIRAIDGEAAHVTDLAPADSASFPVRHGETVVPDTLILGVTPNYIAVRDFSLLQGGFITDRDDQASARVAVLGYEVADKLFGTSDPLGKYILVQRIPCQVIGVMQELGDDLSGINQDKQVYVPLRTFLHRIVNRRFMSMLYIKVKSAKALKPAQKEIQDILRRTHQIRPDQRDDFTVVDLKDANALQTQTMATINALGKISALISFFIGGLGILSIMTLLVNERKLEIGVRRAVGSRNRDIVTQFLLESSFISFTGAVAGVVVGFVGCVVIFRFFKLPFSLSITGFVISIIASIAVGLLGGVYPAKKATAIQPVNILRS